MAIALIIKLTNGNLNEGTFYDYHRFDQNDRIVIVKTLLFNPQSVINLSNPNI